MQNYWLRASNADNIVIFVLGWSCDHQIIEHITSSIPGSYDILCTYDYRTIEQAPDISRYNKRYLFAWSFGVWAAEQIFAALPASNKFTRAIALCGSPHPVDEKYGITPKRLLITLKGLAKFGTDEFNKRTYGQLYEGLKDKIDCRDIESNIAELTALYQSSSKAYSPNIAWDKCIIGSDDVIFPLENLLRFWDIRARVLPLPHYPFENANLILQELEIR